VIRRAPFLWNSDDLPFKHLDYRHRFAGAIPPHQYPRD
jgi:hypothetical protein